MNKWVSVLVVLVMAFSACKDDVAFRSFKPEDVRAVLKEQQQAWNQGDLEGFMSGYWKSDSVKFIAKNGVVNGWSNMLGNYKKGYPDAAAMGKLQFDILAIEELEENHASVTGRWTLTETEKASTGHFLLIFRKMGDQWRIITDCTS